MLSLNNLRDFFFWFSGMGSFMFFVFVMRWFVAIFKRGDK